MVKHTKEHIPKDEIKLLSELQKNSNEKLDLIAKRCGFSRQKAWRLIKELEDNKLIWGYTAITNHEIFDQKQFMMFVKRTNKPLDKKIMEKIDSMDLENLALPLGVAIESSCYVHGNYDWIISFFAQDITQAKAFCNLLYTEFPDSIEKIDIQQILYFVRDHFIFNPDRKKLYDLMD